MLITKTGCRSFTSPQQEESFFAYFWCTNPPDKILRTSRLSQAVCEHANIPLPDQTGRGTDADWRFNGQRRLHSCAEPCLFPKRQGPVRAQMRITVQPIAPLAKSSRNWSKLHILKNKNQDKCLKNACVWHFIFISTGSKSSRMEAARVNTSKSWGLWLRWRQRYCYLVGLCFWIWFEQQEACGTQVEQAKSVFMICIVNINMSKLLATDLLSVSLRSRVPRVMNQ